MSKLESFIRRMSAQRDCLDHAAGLIGDRPGCILELGLGNGRTYDHLRQLFPDRDIYVFDRQVKSYRDCTPPAELTFIGDVIETLPAAVDRIGRTAVLVHSDLGTTDEDAADTLQAAIVPALGKLVAEGGIIVSNRPLDHPLWDKVDTPPSVKKNRYFLYRSR